MEGCDCGAGMRFLVLGKQKKGLRRTVTPFSLHWWASRESNTAPTDYESAALTRHELEALGSV
ncbi:protein of unknown function [Cupriavidus taiwanensis]|uniref:Uncharacterized protein n=1 Tax=Cupriavidus taiwanensis TaxID=164546 RepID=A0A7Z7JCF6_9BURK|nr:protein of unknown function [Cupriavidus taiwanensis]SPC18609.1 hypothetical protein CBM2594_A80048 [Cupriavidus taiwanensis]